MEIKETEDNILGCKMLSGELIICTCDFSIEEIFNVNQIYIKNPVAISVMNNTSNHESIRSFITMNRWIPIDTLDEDEFVIFTKHIMTFVTLKEDMIKSYLDFVYSEEDTEKETNTIVNKSLH